MFEIQDEEHQNDLATVTAEAVKGGIPDNFDDQKGKVEEPILEKAMPSQPVETAADAADSERPTPEEDRDAAIE